MSATRVELRDSLPGNATDGSRMCAICNMECYPGGPDVLEFDTYVRALVTIDRIAHVSCLRAAACAVMEWETGS
jgi:hypothetical protein